MKDIEEPDILTEEQTNCLQDLDSMATKTPSAKRNRPNDTPPGSTVVGLDTELSNQIKDSIDARIKEINDKLSSRERETEKRMTEMNDNIQGLKSALTNKDKEIEYLKLDILELRKTVQINHTANDQVNMLTTNYADITKKNTEDIERLEKKSSDPVCGISQTETQAQLPGISMQFEVDSACKYESLEQYNRRDSIRIFGLTEAEEENTNTLVLETATAMGARICPGDVSISHRLPTRNNDGKPRPIIVKFTRRDMKASLMTNKQYLLRSQNHFNVFIREDVTKPRARAIYALRQEGHKLSTEDGKIIVGLQKERKTVLIHSLYDLHTKLQWPLNKLNNLFSNVKQ